MYNQSGLSIFPTKGLEVIQRHQRTTMKRKINPNQLLFLLHQVS